MANAAAEARKPTKSQERQRQFTARIDARYRAMEERAKAEANPQRRKRLLARVERIKVLRARRVAQLEGAELTPVETAATTPSATAPEAEPAKSEAKPKKKK